MARPRKNPSGAEGETLITTIERAGHLARVGEREYLRIPQANDVKMIETGNVWFPIRNYETVEVFKNLNDLMSELSDKYIHLLEIKEKISKYMDTLSEEDYNSQNKKWILPASVLHGVMGEVEEMKEDTFWKNGLNSFLINFLNITVCMPNELPLKDDPWAHMKEVE